tara:strand:- start:127 stop:501 length:375 start_codon:yes stop_codon:yes gene_type:complete
MKFKQILIILFLVILIYPIYSVFQLFENQEGVFINYQISIWISWILMIAIATVYKWRSKKNMFFYWIYAVLVIGFAILGFYLEDQNVNYRMANFVAIKNFLMAMGFTLFIQVSIWWFSRKWHRE